jgi:hypothetical protein
MDDEATFHIRVFRVIREDVFLDVKAQNPEDALDKAQLEATNLPQERWDQYDCEYDCEEWEIGDSQ